MTIVPFLAKVNAYILNPIIYLMFTLSATYFIYGIVKFLASDATDKPREEARNAILWGIVGMAIMFSVYGIIYFVLVTFGVDSATVINGVKIEPTSYLKNSLPK